MAGLTFDTGALIALERKRHRMRKIFSMAVADGIRVTVPTAVVLEWWRRRSDLADDILASVDVEPLDLELAKMAGTALAAVARATPIDALVMASAARRGDVVYTSDFGDLARLEAHFRSVRVLSV
jgi:predicted nucleic acid-binding protein